MEENKIEIMKKTLLIAFVLSGLIASAQESPDIQYFNDNVVAKVVAYNAETDRLTELYKTAKEQHSPDTAKINQDRKETVQNCFQVPLDFIKKYPSSILCIDALNMLSGKNGPGVKSPVQLADLERLFHSLTLEVKSSNEGLKYAKQLASWQWMLPLRKAVDDQKTISSKDVALTLSEATGKKVTIRKKEPIENTLSEGELSAKVKSATLIVGMAYSKNEEGKGNIQVNPTTAYVIDESGICVTNYHVLKEYSSKSVYVALFVMSSNGKCYPVTKVLAASEADDIAIFQLDLKGDKLPALPIGETAKEGSPVYVMSHPEKNFYEFTSGVLAGYKTETFLNQFCEIISITAEFNIGSSGGPIVDAKGNVVGTVSRIQKMTDGSIVKKGIPVSALKKVISIN